jgi:hypothetical protein
MNINAGITHDEIIKFMNDAQKKAKEFYAKNRVDPATRH